MQDQELKKYICKDLGDTHRQSLLSGLRDPDVQDEQMRQLPQFVGQDEKEGGAMAAHNQFATS